MVTGRLKMLVVLLAALFVAAGSTRAGYSYDPEDFATQVVEYVEGTGMIYDWVSGLPINDPNAALGCPTIDTSGDGMYIPTWDPAPVLAVYPPFRSYEIVTIGEGGRLTVKFDRKVRDNPYNPYGVDVIIFGNAKQIIGGGSGWTNGNPHETIVGGSVSDETGIVSVSQDGSNWYTFPTPDPNAIPPVYGGDDFAPTLGRIYDDANPDPALGAWNLWWGEPTNPTYPLDPTLTPADFSGMTVAQMAQEYGTSAGGTGLDIAAFETLPLDPETNMKWIQYVRIENPPESGVTPEIDALADVFARRPGDANLDGLVNVGDLGILGGNYGQNGGMRWEHGDFNGDGGVDVGDLGILGANYGFDNGEVGAGGAALPEPSTVLILCTGALVLRRRHA